MNKKKSFQVFIQTFSKTFLKCFPPLGNSLSTSFSSQHHQIVYVLSFPMQWCYFRNVNRRNLTIFFLFLTEPTISIFGWLKFGEHRIKNRSKYKWFCANPRALYAQDLHIIYKRPHKVQLFLNSVRSFREKDREADMRDTYRKRIMAI